MDNPSTAADKGRINDIRTNIRSRGLVSGDKLSSVSIGSFYCCLAKTDSVCQGIYFRYFFIKRMCSLSSLRLFPATGSKGIIFPLKYFLKFHKSIYLNNAFILVSKYIVLE